MDYLIPAVALVFLAGAVMMLLGSRSRGADPSAARLATVERKLDLIMKHLGVVDQVPQDPDVVQFLMQGQKIQAIKAYRERTGAGLREAKDEVERIARERGLDPR
jgi:ribosomal protein L7/L12